MANNGPNLPSRPSSALPTQPFHRAESVQRVNIPQLEQPGSNATLQASDSSSALSTPKSGSSNTTQASSTAESNLVKEASRTLHKHHKEASQVPTDESKHHHHKKGERMRTSCFVSGLFLFCFCFVSVLFLFCFCSVAFVLALRLIEQAPNRAPIWPVTSR
jgi:hypothetical protein